MEELVISSSPSPIPLTRPEKSQTFEICFSVGVVDTIISRFVLKVDSRLQPFYVSWVQAIDEVLFLTLCVHVMSQAPQHFSFSDSLVVVSFFT